MTSQILLLLSSWWNSPHMATSVWQPVTLHSKFTIYSYIYHFLCAWTCWIVIQVGPMLTNSGITWSRRDQYSGIQASQLTSFVIFKDEGRPTNCTMTMAMPSAHRPGHGHGPAWAWYMVTTNIAMPHCYINTKICSSLSLFVCSFVELASRSGLPGPSVKCQLLCKYPDPASQLSFSFP